MNELLKIRGLTVRFHTYNGIVQALDNVDLDIKQKETFGLVGETGCGKTVTALSILRLVPSPGKIECGSIYFNANNKSGPVNLLALSEDKIREIRGSRISMIFQEPSAALNPVYTIGDQILEVILLHRQQELAERALEAVNRLDTKRKGIVGLLARPIWSMEKGLYQMIGQSPYSLWPRIVGRIPVVRRLLWRLKDEAEKMALSVLKDVEIPDAERILKQYPHQLSGGMKQRAVIAMALACSPKFLIADEPTTSLDVTIQAQILELLRRLKVERESSILYITHDLAVTAEICDRIGVMYAGSICEVAGVDDIYTNPMHPYTEALMAAVPKPGEEPQAIGGGLPDPINPPSGCRFHPRCPHTMHICHEDVPPMHELTPGHFVACHIYQRGETSGSSS
jgi:peptide/nickel transport system ATP-binding protein